jgi:poly(hydroxyalkanoate) granule-associated protein
MTETSQTEATSADAKTAEGLDIARKIWLAGVGAYGRLYAETQGVVEKLASSAGETFEELVAHGEVVEEKVRKSLARSPQVEKVAQAVETATAKTQSFTTEQRSALDARIGKLRDSLSETLAPWNLPALGQAVDKLSAQVAVLTQEVAALKAREAAQVKEPA